MIDDLWINKKKKWAPRPASLRQPECVASAALVSRGLPDLGSVWWLIALQEWIVPEQFLQHLRDKQVFGAIC